MKRFLWGCVACLAFCASPAFAGRWVAGPYAFTFRTGATNGAKTQRPDGSTPKAPMDLICFDGSEEAWIETVVPYNAAGTNWVCDYQWVMSTTSTNKFCMTMANTVCKDNQDCQDLTPGNATTTALDGVGTADRLETDTAAAFAIRDVGGAADCSAGNCAGNILLIKFSGGTAGGCTQTTGAEEVCLKKVDCSYNEP